MNLQPIGKVLDQSPGGTGATGIVPVAKPHGGESARADSSTTTSQVTASRVQPTAEQMQHVSDMLNKEIARVSQTLQFSVDKQTGKTVIKVMDSSTDEVIRQIPSEDALELSQALDRLQGLLIKSKA